MRLPSGNIWRIFSYALATGLALGLLCYGLVSFVGRQFTPGPELAAVVALGIGFALGWFLFIAGKLALRLAVYDVRHTAAEITGQPVERFAVGHSSDEFEVLRATVTHALALAPNSHLHGQIDQEPEITPDLPQRFADAIAQLAAGIPLAGAALLLYDADRAAFVPTLAWNMRLPDQNLMLSADEAVVHKALRHPHEVQVVGDEAHHVLNALGLNLADAGNHAGALLNVPLIVANEPIGMLVLIGTSCTWSEHDVEPVRRMTSLLTLYVQEARLTRDLALERERFETLAQLAIALPHEPQLERALERTLRIVAEATDSEHGTLLVLDKNQEIHYRIALTQGTLAPLQMVARSVLRNGLAGWTLRERRATLIADTQSDTRWLPIPGLGEMRSALAVPLIYEDEAFGVLTLAHAMPGHYSSRSLTLAAALTAQLAHMLAYARIGELLEQQPSETTAQPVALPMESERQVPHVAQAVVLQLQLRHFASVSEQLAPAVLIDHVLVPYTERFTAAVQAQHGYVDRCDGTMAVAAFGYPQPAPDAATRAMTAALEVQQALRQLRASWRTQLHCDLSFGIGVAQGNVTVGSVEGAPRQTSVLVGTAVNQAQRLQELARPGEVLCSAAVAAALREQSNGLQLKLQALQPLHTRAGDEQPFRLLTREDRVYDTH